MKQHVTRIARASIGALAGIAMVSLTACEADDASEPSDTNADVAEDAGTDTTEADTAEADSVEMDVPDDTGGIPTPDALGGACELAVRAGVFVVEAGRFGSVAGSMASGVVPVTILEETVTEGDCRLMKRNNPFCSPPCSSGETCDFDGSCIAFPETLDIGDVVIDGLAEGSVTMSAVPPGNNYFNTSVPNPPFAPDTTLRLSTSDSPAQSATTLFGCGFELITGTAEWQVAPGEDLEINWEAPTTPDPLVSVSLEMNVDQHGNSPVILQCEFDDDGAATIPASVIDALLEAGVTGFPNGVLRRRTVDSVSTNSLCMEFEVSSKFVPDVTVDGHTPCSSNADCPDGQTCNVAIESCL